MGATKWRYLLLDTYSLSIFRIVLGISLLYSLWIKVYYATEFWGATPMIPLATFQTLNGNNSFSIFDLIRSDTFAYLFFGITAICVAFYTIGYKTRWIAPLTCFFYWNILQASSSFAFGFDFYTFQLLFWSCFLPLDNHFAIKSQTDKAVKLEPNLLFCVIFLYQIAWIYFATGLAKYGVSWIGGYAVQNMLHDKWATTSLGAYLANSYWFYMPATYLTLMMECLFPLFIFLPFKILLLRYIAVTFLLLFHLSILLTYQVANFSVSGIAVALLLLPTHFWKFEWLHRSETTKASDLFVSLQSYKKYGSYFFVLLAFWVITWKNIFFCANHTAWNQTESAQNFLKHFAFLNPLTPIKISFFTQFWKMFAPNPPIKAGWVALEVEKEDGFTYDFFTDKLIEEEPRLNWTPVRLEYYLLLYARNFDFPDGKGDRYKLFLKYWIPYKIKNHHFPTTKIDNLIFTDYLYIVAKQPILDTVKYNSYRVYDIVNQDINELKLGKQFLIDSND